MWKLAVVTTFASILATAGCGGEPGPVDVSTLSGRIAFSASTDDVYVVNADGSGLRRLTKTPGWDFDPAWSPDGRQIAFRRQPGDDTTSDIYVMNADGSSRRNLTASSGALRDWGPAWSPGSRIAYNSEQGSPPGLLQLRLVSADGSRRRQVKSIYVEYPAWSPDGRRVAFMSPVPVGSENYEIFVMKTDGSGVRRLTTSPGPDGWPAWSPDGERIAFSSVRDDCSYSTREGCKTTGDIGPFHTMYVMQADGSKERRLTDRFGQFAVWSPDGDYILFAPGLNVVRPDGTGLVQIRVDVRPEPEMPDWIG